MNNTTQSFSGNKTFTGNVVVQGTTTLSLLGAGIVSANGSGLLSSGTIDRNSATYFTGTLSVANGGTGQNTFASNGVLYGNGTGGLLVATSSTTGQLLLTNASGVPTFTTLSGDVTISNTGVTTIGANKVTNGDLANSSLTVATAANSGLQGGGSISLGGTANLSVNFGSGANQVAAGSTTFNCTSGTGNLTGGGGTITIGSGGTCGTVNTIPSPTFTNLTTTGTVANQLGSDYATTGSSNDVNFSGASTIRLTGSSAQTITGISGGINGQRLTLINAGSTTATISNNNSGSLVANRITTGTGADVSLPVGNAVSLVYDSTASLWRVVGSSSAPSGVTTVGTIDGNGTSSNGSSISGNTIYLQSASASVPGLVNNTTQSFSGNKTFNGDLTLAGSGTGLSVSNSATIGTGLSVVSGGANITGNTSISGTTISNTVTNTTSSSITNTVTGVITETKNSLGDVIQNASSQNVLQIDTLNGNINVGSVQASTLTPPSGGSTIGTFAATTSLGTSCGSAVYGASSVAYRGFIYVLGGSTSGTSAVNTVCYATLDPSTGVVGTWTTTNNLPSQLYNATAVVHNGYVYVIGGANGTSDQTAIYSAPINLNGTLGTWTTAANSLPIALEQMASAINHDFVYVLGGSSNGANKTTVYYAPLFSNGTIGTWATTTALTANSGNTTDINSFVNNGYIYDIEGGNSTACTASSTANIYFASMNSNGTIGAWTSTNASYYAKWGSDTVTWGGYIYNFGGTSTAGGSCGAASVTQQSTQINSDGTVNTPWAPTTNPYPAYLATSVAYNNYVYRIGGSTSSTAPSTGLSTVQFASINGNQGTGTGNGNVNFTVNGNALVQTANGNSSTAFQVQNALSVNVLGVDTTSSNVSVTGQFSVTGGVNISGISTPAAPSVSSSGTNNGSFYSYEVSAVNAYGNYTSASGAGTTPSGASTLTTSNFSVITWAGVPGAAKYYIYRVLNGGSLGYIAAVSANNNSNSYSFNDTGLTATFTNGAVSSGVPAPATDTSGQLSATGTALFQNATNSTTAFEIQNHAGNSNLLIADTTDSRIGIGTATPGNLLSVNSLGAASSTAQVAISTGGTGNIGLLVQGANSQTANIIDIQTYNGSTATSVLSVNGSGRLNVGASGDSSTVPGSGTLFQNNSDSTNAFEIQNHAGNSNLLIADTTNSKIGIGLAPASGGASLQVSGVINASGSLSIGGVTVCTSTGCTGPGTGGSPSYIQNNSSGTAQTANFFIQSAGTTNVAATIESAGGSTVDILDILMPYGSGTKVASFDKNGSLTLANTSTTAFQIQNSSGTSLFVADTSNLTITINGILSQGANGTQGTLVLNDSVIKSTQTNALTAGSNVSFSAACGTPTGVTLWSGSTNSAGSVYFTPSASSANCTVTITFAKPFFASAPKSAIVVPATQRSAIAAPFVSSVSTTSITVGFGATPNTTANGIYWWIVE